MTTMAVCNFPGVYYYVCTRICVVILADLDCTICPSARSVALYVCLTLSCMYECVHWKYKSEHSPPSHTRPHITM